MIAFLLLLVLLTTQLHSSIQLFQIGAQELELAEYPPRGWNSYDSFSWIITEEVFLRNAEIVAKRLLPHGYQYIVVDYLWYRAKVNGSTEKTTGFDSIDEWGRPIPDPERWPSSRQGKGFSEVSKKVHAMGLKFGIHVMRGINSESVSRSYKILDTTTGKPYVEAGREWRTADIGIKEKSCAWMPECFMSVNTSLGAGRAYLRSLYQQLADWGVDFVKNDCVFGEDLDADQIQVVSDILRSIKRPILYSLSPGKGATPDMAEGISHLVNMYRITADDWDTWADVEAHFNIARDFAAANKIGANGLRGKSWPDLDMLPLGWLTDPGVNKGPHRQSRLTLDEQKTQMTLWSIAKSPLMFGGDTRNLDDTTFNIITNPTLLEINTYSSNNKEFVSITRSNDSTSENYTVTRRLTSPKKYVLSLATCRDQEAKGWASHFLAHRPAKICWHGYAGRKSKSPYCLYRRNPLLTSDGESSNQQRYDSKIQLCSKEKDGLCLHAALDKKSTAGEAIRRFSRCKPIEGQIWELNPNGTLVSNYSDLCAKMTVKANDTGGGIRSWIATGRNGELYVAFFNLDPQEWTISSSLSSLSKAIPTRSINTCNHSEVWSGKELGVTTDVFSAQVASHGCALLVFKCS